MSTVGGVLIPGKVEPAIVTLGVQESEIQVGVLGIKNLVHVLPSSARDFRVLLNCPNPGLATHVVRFSDENDLQYMSQALESSERNIIFIIDEKVSSSVAASLRQMIRRHLASDKVNEMREVCSAEELTAALKECLAE